MAKVMVSGPFSALMTRNSSGAFQFSDTFRGRLVLILELLASAGHEVFSAHTADSYGERPWVEDFVDRDLHWTSSCNVQLVLQPASSNGDVVRSDGTMIELGYAHALGKPIIILADNLDHEQNSFFLRSFPRREGVELLSWDEGFEPKLLDAIHRYAPSADAAAVRRRHTTDVDAVLAELRADKKPHKVEVAGMELDILPGVLSPRLSHAPDALMAIWDIPEGSAVLDLGCGSGILGLAALRQGAASLVALDINPQAVKTTELNIANLGYEDRAAARISDGYSSLLENEKFDTIIFAAPYWNREAKDDLDRSCFDQDYVFFRKAIIEAPAWLDFCGSMYVIFSDQGDVSLALRIIEDSGLVVSEMHMQRPTQPGGHIRIIWKLKHATK
jgi:SAM-dependent methyltransferase